MYGNTRVRPAELDEFEEVHKHARKHASAVSKTGDWFTLTGFETGTYLCVDSISVEWIDGEGTARAVCGDLEYSE
jgi:hypothetical protein